MNETMKKTVLIVDDEEDLTWSISRSLEREGKSIHVIGVNSGSEALSMLERERVDLLITDLRMPGVHGSDLIRHIHESGLGTKIIVITAYGLSELQKHNLMVNQCHYLEKPFEMATLKEMVFEILSDKPAAEGEEVFSRIRRLALMTKEVEDLKVTVFHGEESGKIFFSNGRIRHAESGERSGKEALREILNWKDCRLEAESESGKTDNGGLTLLQGDLS